MIKWSNFHVTINFNKDDMSIIHPFRSAIEAMVEPPQLWQWLKHYDGSQQVDFSEEEKQKVETVRLRAAFEHEGERNKGLHCHIVIEIGHSTMVQISKFGLCDLFRRYVGLNPNVHCRFLKGSGEDKDYILMYLTKEVPMSKPSSQLNSRLKYAFSGNREEVEAEHRL